MRRLSRTGFTLIELLVVISIIGLLVAILLPALSHARDSARAVTCSSRMRQVSIGWTIYADENRSVIVPGQHGRFSDESKNVYWVGNGFQYRPRWYVTMGAAVGFHAFSNPSPDPAFEHSMQITDEVFLCPTVPGWTSTRNNAYGYNYQFLGNARFRGDNESNGFIQFPVRIDFVKDASQTVMATDAMGTAAGKPRRRRTENRSDGSRDWQGIARGGHGYVLDPPRLTGTSDFADTRMSSPEHRSGPDERHQDRANVAFCDGHVQAMTAQEMGYRKGPDGSILDMGNGATNALFSGSMRDDDPPDVN